MNKIFNHFLRYPQNMKLTVGLFLFFGCFSLHAQTGGLNSFALLDLTYNARAAALGNDFISVKDKDLSLVVANPSLLNEGMDKKLSLSQALLAGGINYGQVVYGRSALKGMVSGHIRYVNYGEFRRMDIAGNDQGTFNPFEAILGAGYGKQLNPRISVGTNVNFIYSQLESYSSFGATVDLAGVYTSVDENFTATALVKHVGYQFKAYYNKQRAFLPTEFQLAGSYKLAHAPFRFSILAHHLNRWDLTYTDPNKKAVIDPLTGDIIPLNSAGFGEKFARHFSYAVELLISKHVHLRSGFDYQRRQEMKLESRPGAAGFTFGAGLNFKKFNLDYGLSIFSRAGYLNMLTLSTNLSEWKK